MGPSQYLYIAKYYGYNNTGYDVSLDTFKNAALIERLHAEKIRWNKTEQMWEFISWEKKSLGLRCEKLTGFDLSIYYYCSMATPQSTKFVASIANSDKSL